MADQMRIGEATGAPPGRVAFATDDQLGRELEQAESGLAHLEEMMPRIRQSIATVRAQLQPTAGGG